MANAFLLAHRLRRSQLALACGALVQASGVAILYAAGALGVREALLAYAGFIAVPWALHLLWARGTLPVRPSRDWALGRRVVALGLKFYVGLTFSFLLLRFDIVLVNLYLQPADVGIYSIAVLFAELAWLITNPLVQAAVPFQASVPMRESAPLAFKTARFNMALALVLALAFAATMWFVLPFLYGTRFRDAYIPLVVLLPGIVAMAASRPLGLLVGRQLRPLLYSAATLGALSVNCALNILLLPRIGIVGASVASAVSYALLAATFIAWSLKASSLTARQALVPGRDDFDTVRRALGRLRALGAGHRA
jgi:O-antigen/teichoic acid export membrane protein